jgi:hypothetical protein
MQRIAMPVIGVAEVIAGLTAGMSHQQRVQQVRFIARLMDEQFVVPGTNLRFGLDTVLGILPGLGDAITSAISLLIVHHAWQTGAFRSHTRANARQYRSVTLWRRCARGEEQRQECGAIPLRRRQQEKRFRSQTQVQGSSISQENGGVT